MNEYQTALESSIKEIDKLRATLKKEKSVQVRSIDEKSIIKATALTWFNKHRSYVEQVIDAAALAGLDSIYKDILALSEKQGSRLKFDAYLKQLKVKLSAVMVDNVAKLSTSRVANSNNLPPNFAPLIGDQKMIQILDRRWGECIICVNNNAPLSAIVMMGGLLESLLLSKFLSFPDKNKIPTANNCPKDKTTGKVLNYTEWALKNYIDVAHELGWISQTEKDLGIVLRDYRNYIHPFKEKSHGIILEPKDAKIMWEVTKSISRQITYTII